MARSPTSRKKPPKAEIRIPALGLTISSGGDWVKGLRKELDEALLIAQHPQHPIFMTKEGYPYSLLDPEPPAEKQLPIRNQVPGKKVKRSAADVAAQPDIDDVAERLSFPTVKSVPKELKPRNRLTLTVEEAAEALGISRALAYEAVRRGEIPNIKIGRRLLVPKVALDRLLQAASPSDTE